MQRLELKQDNLTEVIEQARLVLSRGGLIIYPTETLYGAGVDATNQKAVGRLLQYKNRPAGKAISVLVADQDMAQDYVELNDTARNIYTTFLPGPVTVISKSLGRVDPRLESEIGNLGIRISSDAFASSLATGFGKPITATSANASGKPRPYSVEQVLSGLTQKQIDLIDLIIDAGVLPKREPSTVIDTTLEVQQILRAGEKFTDISPAKHSASEEETRRFAFDLMKSLLHRLPEHPVVFALEGDLGAGKTQFAKGVAEALEVKQPVTSPTFNIIKEYEGLARLIHIDCWRLDQVTPEDLELAEYLKPGHVLVVEWASPVLPFLHEQDNGLHLLFEVVDENNRIIRMGEL